MSDPQQKFEYQLLGRLQQDCDYYLGAGARNKKHLWALDEALQIQKMKELYEGLAVKPEWLTLEAIQEYEEKMVGTQSESAKERCWKLISELIDSEGPGTASQIEYDELAGRYGDLPNDEVWQEFLRALKSEREGPVPRA